MSKNDESTNLGSEYQADSSPGSEQPVSKFVNPGILLFAAQLLTAVGSWAYWLVVSKFVQTSEIGHATTIYSLVLLVNMIAQLGLEYPLLKKSLALRQKIFGTITFVELSITLAAIPLVFFATASLYQESSGFTWIAIGILILSSMGFVSRFALLGLSMSKTILILDLIGTTLKFGSALALVTLGYGATGILLSFLIQAAVTTFGTTIIAGRSFGLGIGNGSFIKETVKDGLVNLPSKLSGMLIISLSVVLLAWFGVDSSEVGVFYIAMMISIVVGSFASSLAFMSIPASSAMKKDLSSGSMRIGLAFTAPIIAALIVAPNFILSVLGSQYTQASEILVVLSIGVLPSVILSNAMSRFNNQNKPRHLVAIGGVRVAVFLASFVILVPLYGTPGAAYSILISFSASASISLIWSEKVLVRFVGIAILSILSGVLAGKLAAIFIQDHSIMVIAASTVVSILVILALKCTSIKEIATIMASVRRV